MLSRIRRIFELLKQPRIYSFISPSIDIAAEKKQYESLIDFPDDGIIRQFEDNLSEFIGGGYVITFAAGRMAFYSLLKNWNIKEGDEVALTGFTCAVMANAVLRTGATPIFVDIDETTLGMSPIDLKRKISPRTKVVVAQHTFGIPCKIDEIKIIAEEAGCYLVEDCAISLGSTYKGIKIGNWGHAAIFSTDHTKPLNTLIGGYAYTNDNIIADGVKAIRDRSNELSKEHQRLILNWYVKEHEIETTNHKRYIVDSYLRAIKHKLHLNNEDTPYLELESSSDITIKGKYQYPSKMPSFLAKIGISCLDNYIKMMRERKEWINKLISVFKDYESIPKAYSDSNFDIIPLRFAYVAKKTHSFKFDYIDDWIWFKKPIVATSEDLQNFGYIKGTCPISERIGESIMNLPIILDKIEQERFLSLLKKTIKNN